MVQDGKSREDAAKAVGCSVATLTNWLKAAGLVKTRSRKGSGGGDVEQRIKDEMAAIDQDIEMLINRKSMLFGLLTGRDS